MEQWVTDHPMQILIIAGVVVVIAIVIAIIVHSRTKAKKRDLLGSNPNLVEVVFDELVATPNPVGGPLGRSQGFTLFSVNGQTPKILGRSILVPAGDVVLDYEYAFQTAGKSFATSMGRRTFTFPVVPGKKYTLSFNYIDKTINYKEK